MRRGCAEPGRGSTNALLRLAAISALGSAGWCVQNGVMGISDLVKGWARALGAGAKGAGLRESRDRASWQLVAALSEFDAAKAREALSAGADPDALVAPKERVSCLHHAARFGELECVQALIEAGAKIDARDIRGATPLLVAAGQRDAKTVEALVRAGADARLADKSGKTPLMQAALARDPDSCELLVAISDLSARDALGQTASDQARSLHWDADAGRRLVAAIEAEELRREAGAAGAGAKRRARL